MYNNKRTFLLAFLLLGGGLLAVLYYNQRKTLVDTYYDIYALRELQPIKAMKAYEDFFKNEENKQWWIDDNTKTVKKKGFHWMQLEEVLTLLQSNSDLKTLYIAYMKGRGIPWGKEVSHLDQPLLQPYHQQHAQLRKQVRAELPALLEKERQQTTDDNCRKMTLLGLAARELANAVSIRVWDLEAVAYAKSPKEQERLQNVCKLVRESSDWEKYFTLVKRQQIQEREGGSTWLLRRVLGEQLQEEGLDWKRRYTQLREQVMATMPALLAKMDKQQAIDDDCKKLMELNMALSKFFHYVDMRLKIIVKGHLKSTTELSDFLNRTPKYHPYDAAR